MIAVIAVAVAIASLSGKLARGRQHQSLRAPGGRNR
jgi:hypothetical protein